MKRNENMALPLDYHVGDLVARLRESRTSATFLLKYISELLEQREILKTEKIQLCEKNSSLNDDVELCNKKIKEQEEIINTLKDKYDKLLSDRKETRKSTQNQILNCGCSYRERKAETYSDNNGEKMGYTVIRDRGNEYFDATTISKSCLEKSSIESNNSYSQESVRDVNIAGLGSKSDEKYSILLHKYLRLQKLLVERVSWLLLRHV